MLWGYSYLIEKRWDSISVWGSVSTFLSLQKCLDFQSHTSFWSHVANTLGAWSFKTWFALILWTSLILIDQGCAVIGRIWFDVYPKVPSITNYLLLQVPIESFKTSFTGILKFPNQVGCRQRNLANERSI